MSEEEKKEPLKVSLKSFLIKSFLIVAGIVMIFLAFLWLIPPLLIYLGEGKIMGALLELVAIGIAVSAGCYVIKSSKRISVEGQLVASKYKRIIIIAVATYVIFAVVVFIIYLLLP